MLTVAFCEVATSKDIAMGMALKVTPSQTNNTNSRYLIRKVSTVLYTHWQLSCRKTEKGPPWIDIKTIYNTIFTRPIA